MRVIPVLDLLDSVVVRGVAGRRDEYRPVQSQISVSASPGDVANGFRQQYGSHSLYVADLDAILRGELNREVLEELSYAGFELLVDAGVRNAADVDPLFAAGATKVIVALETWPLLSSLELLVSRVGSDRLIFSLDLKAGQLVRGFHDFVSNDPLDVAAAVIEVGLRELIVLDVASVGTGDGGRTLGLCQGILDFAPKTALITGGGIRNVDDLRRLSDAGIDGCLVASALHDGSIAAADINSL